MTAAYRRAASASSDQIPLLEPSHPGEEGLMKMQLADVKDELPPAPRRLEEVPLVGAPAVEEDEATKTLRRRVRTAALGLANTAELEQLRKDLASLPTGQAERILTTGYWEHSTLSQSWRSAIHLAAHNSVDKYTPTTVEVFEVLLHNRRHLLKLRNEREGSKTPLHVVVEKGGGTHLVENFIEWGRKDLLQAQDTYGRTPLHCVAEKGGGAHLVENFIQWGGKDLLKAQTKYGNTPLHFAAKHGSVGVVEKFVERGGKELLEARDNRGYTPLHSAAENNLGDTVEKLIDLGGKELLKAVAKDGRNPLHFAARQRNVKMVNLILRMQPDLLEKEDNAGKTPIDVAFFENTEPKVMAAVLDAAGDMVIEILKSSGNMDALESQDKDGWTLLHHAARDGRAEAVGLVLKVKPDLLKIKNNDGKPPLDLVLDKPKVVAVMVGVAGEVTLKLLGTSGEKVDRVVKPEVLQEVVPAMKAFLRKRVASPGLDSLQSCSVFRHLMQSRPKDSLTDDLEGTAGWSEAFVTGFCTGTGEKEFRDSLKGSEEKFIKLLESAEPLTVVTQANCVSLVTHHWQRIYESFLPLEAKEPLTMMKLLGTEFSPRSSFFSRVFSMLLLIFSVLLYTKSIKGDSGMTIAAVDKSVWLWIVLATGSGFILLEIFQAFRLGGSYWKDSWNWLDCASGASIAAFIAIYFIGWGRKLRAVVRMLSDIRMFLLLYPYILLIFAGVFTILSSDEDRDYFASYDKAMLTLFYAGLGNFDGPLNNAIETHDTLGAVLLFTYIILSSIILLNLLIAIMASTYSAIEETQNAQYQLLRIRVLNEYLTMPLHERLPPPFNLVAFVVSAPLRYLASLISRERREQSTVCRIAFWSMVVLYALIDALLFTVAFTPDWILSAPERLLHVLLDKEYVLNAGASTDSGTGCYYPCLSQPADSLLKRLWNTVMLVTLFPFGVLFFFIVFAIQACQEASKGQSGGSQAAEAARRRHRAARVPTLDVSTEVIDGWIRAANSHNATSPDIMAVLQAMDGRLEERLTQMDKRLAEMETQIKTKIH
ncbi:unnamed protein product [Vitrella brassicaformis CCMP3155]|uniref:Ion transport domain-containing protein n=1 Tax=Vitrella brassicaformis (strain CCMP3155) TaxID=1169540 RepID=A0A0G4GPF7_VITBC|nr:unnamed protein product [Vitrella brassicaformis CCMP3155]|eukprot:CEM32241.1 unnamed protein product [Vitrella brassicaformis CCMP3155]